MFFLSQVMALASSRGRVLQVRRRQPEQALAVVAGVHGCHGRVILKNANAARCGSPRCPSWAAR